MPVRDFLQDASGDLAVVNGDFAVVGGQTNDANLAAVRQSIGIRTRLFLGEAWLDNSKGVDWLGKILVKNPNPSTVTTEISTAIASAPDVTNVVAAQLVVGADREASIDYSVGTAYSSAPITGTVTP